MDYNTIKSNWHLFRTTISDQTKGVPMPPYEKEYPKDSVLIDLVPFNEINIGSRPVYEAIIGRRSRRHFTEKPLTLMELSYLLICTQGIIKPQRPMFRTSPSGGARHGLETYLYVENVEGVEKALYRYLPIEHKLLWIGNKPKEDLTEALAGQDFGPAVTFIWSVIPYRIAWRYSHAAEKLALLDVGHVCQNLYIACEAAGMGTCAIGAYFQEKLDKFISVNGREEFAIYASPVGKTKE